MAVLHARASKGSNLNLDRMEKPPCCVIFSAICLVKRLASLDMSCMKVEHSLKFHVLLNVELDFTHYDIFITAT